MACTLPVASSPSARDSRLPVSLNLATFTLWLNWDALPLWRLWPLLCPRTASQVGWGEGSAPWQCCTKPVGGAWPGHSWPLPLPPPPGMPAMPRICSHSSWGQLPSSLPSLMDQGMCKQTDAWMFKICLHALLPSPVSQDVLQTCLQSLEKTLGGTHLGWVGVWKACGLVIRE